MKKLFLIVFAGSIAPLSGFARFTNNSKNITRITVNYPHSNACPDENFSLKPNETHRSPPKGEGCATTKIIFTMVYEGPNKEIEIIGNYDKHEVEITDTKINIRKKDHSEITKEVPIK